MLVLLDVHVLVLVTVMCLACGCACCACLEEMTAAGDDSISCVCVCGTSQNEALDSGSKMFASAFEETEKLYVELMERMPNENEADEEKRISHLGGALVYLYSLWEDFVLNTLDTVKRFIIAKVCLVLKLFLWYAPFSFARLWISPPCVCLSGFNTGCVVVVHGVDELSSPCGKELSL